MCMGGLLQNRLTTLVLILLILGTACSSPRNTRVMSFFFDGVPEAGEAETSGVETISQAVPEDSSSIILADARVYWHEPYRDKECSACHDPDDRSLGDESSLCLSCHGAEIRVFPFEHGPYSGSYCTECHNPHKSEVEHLLLAGKNELCGKCHNTSDLTVDSFHSIAAEGECSRCHASHGSNNHSILLSESCFMCHEDWTQSYKRLHGPAAAGFCSSCHLSHYSGGEKNLEKEGDGLCLSCHEKEETIAIDMHSDLEGFTCMECHNPHGGEDKNLLN